MHKDTSKDLDFEVGFFGSILRRHKSYVEVIEILGGLYTRQGRILEGLKMDRQMVRLCPENSTAHYNLACSLALLKKRGHALNALRKAVDAPGDARPDLAILADLFTTLSGKPAPSEAALHSQVAEQKGPFAPATGQLHGAVPALTAPATPEMQLLVGKCPFHFGTETTYSAANLELAPAGALLINPADAARLGIKDGDQFKVTSPAGSASGKALLMEKVPVGLLTASDNFADLNILQIMPSGSNCVAVTSSKG